VGGAGLTFNCFAAGHFLDTHFVALNYRHVVDLLFSFEGIVHLLDSTFSVLGHHQNVPHFIVNNFHFQTVGVIDFCLLHLIMKQEFFS
jgi:hypothetical protein